MFSKKLNLVAKNSNSHIDLPWGLSSFAFAWAIGVPGSPPPNPMDCAQLLAVSHELGATRLQLADNLPVHSLDPQSWQQVLAKAQQYAIQLELGIRGLKIDLIERYLRLAKDCQSPFLRVVIDDGDFEPDHDEIVGRIKELLPSFKSHQIPLAIENHDRFLSKEIKAIIEATDPQWVGVCLDTANSLGANEGIYELTRILGPHTLNLHVKDFTIKRFDHNMGFLIEGAPAGKGQTPISWLLEELASYGKCQSATLEVWSSPLESMEATIQREREWVVQGSAYLNSLLGS